METIIIEIPKPDFSFSDIARDKAENICEELDYYKLMLFDNTQFDD